MILYQEAGRVTMFSLDPVMRAGPCHPNGFLVKSLDSKIWSEETKQVKYRYKCESGVFWFGRERAGITGEVEWLTRRHFVKGQS